MFNIQLYNHTKKKKKKLPSSLKTTTINNNNKELLINTIEKRCRRVLGKEKTKKTATTPNATPQQMLTSEYIIQEIILAILLETKELTFNVTKSTTTTTTTSNTINNLLIQASNDRILILQNLKSIYNFKDWAYVIF